MWAGKVWAAKHVFRIVLVAPYHNRLILVRLGATVLAMPIVHVRLPVALVGVAARKRELARAGALVVLPVPGVHGAALVADLALAVPEKAGDLIFGLCTRGGQRGA